MGGLNNKVCYWLLSIRMSWQDVIFVSWSWRKLFKIPIARQFQISPFSRPCVRVLIIPWSCHTHPFQLFEVLEYLYWWSGFQFCGFASDSLKLPTKCTTPLQWHVRAQWKVLLRMHPRICTTQEPGTNRPLCFDFCWVLLLSSGPIQLGFTVLEYSST